jgi:hypothetical protein
MHPKLKPIVASSVPRDRPIRTSRLTIFQAIPLVESLNARCRMTSVADCEPAFPPEASTSGRNRIIQPYTSEI